MRTIVAGCAPGRQVGHAGGMPADPRAVVTVPQPRQSFGKYRVCVVCLGNICRSPTAEAVLRAELARAGLAGRVEVDSAGTGDWHLGGPMHPDAAAELSRHGLDGAGHRVRQFQPSWFERYDLVAAMDSDNLADLLAMAPDRQAAGRVRLLRSFDPAQAGGDGDLDVPDPYGGDAADYEHVFELVQAAARGLADQLARLLAGPSAAPG
jgi:protein-tyrosine phosphatase